MEVKFFESHSGYSVVCNQVYNPKTPAIVTFPNKEDAELVTSLARIVLNFVEKTGKAYVLFDSDSGKILLTDSLDSAAIPVKNFRVFSADVFDGGKYAVQSAIDFLEEVVGLAIDEQGAPTPVEMLGRTSRFAGVCYSNETV